MLKHNDTPKSDTALLVVNPKGHIRVLYCPFRVICIEPVGTFKAGITLWVERVTSTPRPKGQLLYQIYGTLYLFERFVIQINF